ncbi:MAG: flagellar export protein FliJ [Caldilineaceae bacterium]|nr:flagellar export protein FliJ [Caldilineaceae bacterium]
MSLDFRFQAVLDYRQRIVEDRQRHLADAQRAWRVEMDGLDALREQRARFAAQLEEMLQGVLHVDEIEHHYRYLAALDLAIKAQEAVVETAEEAAEAARADLEEALKERKTMEKLKEYDRERLLEAIAQDEAKAVDDLNIARFGRNGR